MQGCSSEASFCPTACSRRSLEKGKDDQDGDLGKSILVGGLEHLYFSIYWE